MLFYLEGFYEEGFFFCKEIVICSLFGWIIVVDNKSVVYKFILFKIVFIFDIY